MSLANKVNFNSTTPAAPSGKRNVKTQDDGGAPTVSLSFYVPNGWGSIATKIANYVAALADAGKFLPCNGTFTVTLPVHNSPVVPNVDADWELYVINIGSGAITVDGSGCTINGASSISLAAGQSALVRVDSGVAEFLAFQGAASGGGSSPDLQFGSGIPGKPGAAAVIFLAAAPVNGEFDANFASSAGSVGTNPTSSAVYTVNKNGSSIGTITISTSGVFTFTTSGGSAQSFSQDDRISIVAPSSQDATLSDVCIRLQATRS